jgi:SAM-dependent methyltransferase/uncharacterized protein YbaR (Trm112 family)
MRYALLDFLACPYCHAELVCYAHREVARESDGRPGFEGSRVSSGPGLGPLPAQASGELAALLRRHAGPAGDPARTFHVEVDEGLLLCPSCGRWYPIAGSLPELLPDHLRDATREAAIFRERAADLPADVRAACERFVPGATTEDAGAHHKQAEIGVKSKVDDEAFFRPGYSSPFNPANTEFTLRLVHLFGAVAPLLEVTAGDVVIDSGCGYGWTTEWLYRSGVNAIGVDICRAYSEIGIARMGPSRPHLVIGDVENLPIRSAVARAILAFESFHHIPDRPRAMRAYSRSLVEGGRLVLAEPPTSHDTADEAVAMMDKLGILEKGMDLADVVRYAAGAGFSAPEQVFLSYALHTDLRRPVLEIARRGSPIDGNLYVLRKTSTGRSPLAADRGPLTADRLPEDAAQIRPKTGTMHTSGDETLTVPSSEARQPASGDRTAESGQRPADPYDANYYADYSPRPYTRDDPEWMTFFGGIADRIAGDIGPKTVLDAGCAMGLLVEMLRRRGVEAFGVDVSEFAIAHVHESVRPYCRVGSASAELDRRYDLIVCLEVLEHMPPADAAAAIASFCRHTDDVLFSSTSGHFEEPTHINVHPPEEWAELFARQGFLRDLEFDATFIAPWAVRFRRRAESTPRLVREYERAFARTAIERNELRNQVLHFDRSITVAAAETPRLREELASVNRQLIETQHKLAQAADRIHHMERSGFWKLRTLWTSLRALVTRGASDPHGR